MSTTLIQLWHERARPEPTDRDFDVQLGCHFEEVAEMLEAVFIDSERAELLQVILNSLAYELKTGRAKARVGDREGFLDSLADQIVTAQGAGHCARLNVPEALRRVNASNWSKFDVNGYPMRDANGKIAKGPNYQAPDLADLCR
jgi:hypothetical protein